MKQLNKLQTAVYLLGAVLMAIGAVITILMWSAAPYVYSLGALAFASMQMLQRYDGHNVTLIRLRRIMLLSDVLFLLTGVLMFASKANVFGLSQLTYLQYVYNKWVATLMLAAIIQLYVTHRISHELAKENKEE